jgi:pimeloyl-ACP methyl ester carboxylesterase
MEVLQITGPSTRAPLVFLHEGLGSVAMWQGRAGDWPAQVCQAAGRAGWVYSRRGYGQSPAIADVRGSGRLGADYMHREAWEVLPTLLHEWGVDKPVLIGHSDGGTIALLHAARLPVAGCVVMAPHLMVEDMTLSAIEAAKNAYEEGDLRQKLSRYHADVDCAFWQWNDVWLSQAFRSFDIREECKAITAPVLALQGADDAYGSLRHLNELHTAGKVERHVLPDCGHSPHKDQAKKSLELVVGFLEGLA